MLIFGARGRASSAAESGQSSAEYSFLTLFLLIGTAAGVAGFLPASFQAYEAYVHGFWLVLGLPIP